MVKKQGVFVNNELQKNYVTPPMVAEVLSIDAKEKQKTENKVRRDLFYLLDYITSIEIFQISDQQKEGYAEICCDMPLFSELGKTFASNHFLINDQILIFK